MPILLYVVIAFHGATWHGAVPIHATTDQARCTALATQLSHNGRRYECHTMVLPAVKT